MKKKLSYKIGVISTLVALMATFICLVCFKPEQKRYSTPAGSFTAGSSKVSAKFEADVLFSAEKVLIDTNADEWNQPIDGADVGTSRAFLDVDNTKYYFKDYYGINGKYVIEHNTFVKLDNNKTTLGEDTIISSKEDGSFQEAVMLSFGQYFLTADNKIDSVEIDANKETLAGKHDDIRILKVDGYHNGEALDMSKSVRVFNVGGDLPRRDFSYLITQTEDNSGEGFYKFDFTYTKNGQDDLLASFQFYIIYDSSYTQEVESNSNIYNAYPTLGWQENVEGSFTFQEKTNNAGADTVVYNDGINGIFEENISYPTITYDYTKYKMRYAHTTSTSTTNYTYTLSTSSVLGSTKHYLNISASGTNAFSQPAKELKAYKEGSTNLVTVVFTEPGSYKFNFDYIYLGYNANVAPAITGMPAIEEKNLTIHGIELEYSKENYKSARLRYYELSLDSDNGGKSKLDLVVANGHEYSDNLDSNATNAQSLEFIYTLIPGAERAGTVVTTKSQDSLINAQLKTKTIYDYDTNVEKSYYNYLLENYNNIEKYNADEIDTSEKLANNLKTILGEIKYVKTNQTSLWFTYGYDYFADGSFYYYSPNKLQATDMFKTVTKEVEGGGTETVTESTKQSFTNQTSFNKNGYYLVFMNVDLIGGTNEDRYYQVYAFWYASDSIDIIAGKAGTVTDVDGVVSTTAPIAQFTNEPVTIAWKTPDIFEKKVKAYYYVAYDNNVDVDDLLNSRKTEFKSGHTFGTDDQVADGTTAEYLIQIQSEGQSSTYKTFTVDKQDIQDVHAYAVGSSNSVYSVAINGDGTKKEIISGITDSIVTLSWQDAYNGYKQSGASISAKYYYTPIVSTTTDQVEKTSDGIVTNYILDKELGPFEDYVRPDNYNRLRYPNMFTKQGIYRVVLTDQAGNSCQYVFVIDQTEAYFQVGTELDREGNIVSGSLVTETTLINGQETYFNIGQNKIIPIPDLAENEQLYSILRNLNNTTYLAELGYHLGTGANNAGLSSLFNMNENKLVVRNEYIYAVDEHFVVDYEISSDKVTVTKTVKEITADDDDNSASSTIRDIYIFGANNIYSATEAKGRPTKNSYLSIEVNTDNSQGYAYYSDVALSSSNLPNNGKNSEDGSVFRLITGSKLERANATSSKHAGFVWLMGTGNTAVSQVSYTYYKLDLTRESANTIEDYNLGYTENVYYYVQEGEEKLLYKSGSFYEENGASTDNTYGYASFSVGGSTPEGLYKITRVYEGAGTENDNKYRNYYFIVDRSGIIDTQAETGENISINLLENETPFKEFSQFNVESGKITFRDTSVVERQVDFGVQLTTNKVPATLSVPVGKFFTNSTLYSNYYDGRLRVRVYYSESMTTTDAVYRLIYDGGTGDDLRVTNGYFNADVYSYLNDNKETALIEKLITTDSEGKTQGKWISAEGTYVLLIEDFTEKVSTGIKNNVKAVGFRIDHSKKPEIEISTGFKSKDSLSVTAVDGEYKLTTSAEFVKVTLPDYSYTDKKLKYIAQVDPNYLVVEQYINGKPQATYVNHPNADKGGTVNSDDIVINGTKTKISSVYLDTKLGEVDLSTEVKYVITVRFKLSADSLSDNYINAYTIGEDKYYETTYTITIDRIAPSENINALVERDNKFISYYNQENGVDSLFVNSYHETNSSIYFTKQYNAYYLDKAKAMSKIYVFTVNDNTAFNSNGIARVGFKTIDDINSYQLNLPVVNQNEYTLVDYPGFENYGDLLYLGEGYYEIIEVDDAGNVAQYVVNYTNSLDNFELKFKTQTTSGSESSVTLNISNTEDLDASISAIEGNASTPARLFYRVEVLDYNKNIIFEENTRIGTNFNEVSYNLTHKIAQAITSKGASTYWIRVITAETVEDPFMFNINLYDRNSNITLDKDKVKIVNNGKYYIKLDGANINVDGLWYYAQTVTINGEVFTGRLAEDGATFIYTTEDGTTLNQNVYACVGENTTYVVTITDTFEKSQNLTFNTSGNDNFYSIDGDYYKEGDTYYSFNAMEIEYDKTLYESTCTITVKEDGKPVSQSNWNRYISLNNGDSVNKITINPYITLDDSSKNIRKVGHVIEVLVEFAKNEYYKVVVDSKIGAVALREFPSGEDKTVVEEFNVQSFTEVTTNAVSTGRMNLITDLESNGQFIYFYTLYKQFEGNITEETITTNVKAITEEGSYWLLVNVYAQDGKTYLGNKVFAFNVKPVSNSLFELKDGDAAVKSNSYFTKEDLDGLTLIDPDTRSVVNLPSGVNFPLYITNKTLTLTYDEDQISESSIKTLLSQKIGQFGKTQYHLEINRIDAGSYKVYFAVMTVEENSDIVENMQIRLDGSVFTVLNGTSTSVVVPTDNKQAIISFEGSRTNNVSANVTNGGKMGAKNTLMLEIRYAGKLVKTVEFATTNFVYNIEGNGNFTYVLKDMAGNIQEFVNVYEFEEYKDSVTGVDIITLREVVVNVKGISSNVEYYSIDNAFYSEGVEISLFSNYMYVNGSISVTATKNGQSYAIGNYPYVFTEYGTYKVNVKAKYLTSSTSEETITISKSFAFTIINEKEARKSIDLTSIIGYKITQVLNNAGEDVTEAFKNTILNANSGISGSYVSYEKIMENAEALNATYGKNTFTVTYVVEDNIYPNRQVTFKFTLNNETPKIDCSLGKGETTNKGFNISFNAGIIYEQIGESFIYINDKVVATIDESSEYTIQKISTTFKKNGAGDYYVKLVNTSGTVIQSFKVTIKEPLNVWAIVIIVVVVVIVITVVTVVIVLRYRMKIR